jgi:hypothetical protein
VPEEVALDSAAGEPQPSTGQDSIWNPSSIVTADLNGDGNEDQAAVSSDSDTVRVGIWDGHKDADPPDWTFRFPIGAGAQNAVCPGQTSLEVEELIRDPDGPAALELGVQELASRLRELPPETKGVALGGADCDRMHIYWDPEREDFEWWRL